MSERVPDRSVYCTHSFRSGRASKAANSGVGRMTSALTKNTSAPIGAGEKRVNIKCEIRENLHPKFLCRSGTLCVSILPLPILNKLVRP